MHGAAIKKPRSLPIAMAVITKLNNMNDISEEVVDHLLVKNCWSKIKLAKGADFFVNSFYQNMFEHHPEVHSFFPIDLSSQKTKLLNTLDNIINGIEYIDALKDELIKLGEQHINLGIQAEMYEYFISTIVATANLSSDSTLTDEELLAWENAFRKVSNIMLEAY